jgi:hypothetical protein
VADEIARSVTVSAAITSADGFIAVRTMAEPVGEYWDICYPDQMPPHAMQELRELKDHIVSRTGFPLEEMEVDREAGREHPLFPDSPTFTYVRICPKAAL